MPRCPSPPLHSSTCTTTTRHTTTTCSATLSTSAMNPLSHRQYLFPLASIHPPQPTAAAAVASPPLSMTPAHRRAGSHHPNPKRSLFLLTFLALTMNVLASAFQRLAFAANPPAGTKRPLSSLFASASTVAAPAEVKAQYDHLVADLKEIDALEGITGLLGWDEQTMLPSGSAPARAHQKASLAGVLHEKRTRAGLGELILGLDKPEALKALPSDYERANVRLARRDWNVQTRKTKAMASKEAELEGKGYSTWVAARKDNDFAAFAPVLEEIVALKTEVCGGREDVWLLLLASMHPFIHPLTQPIHQCMQSPGLHSCISFLNKPKHPPTPTQQKPTNRWPRPPTLTAALLLASIH